MSSTHFEDYARFGCLVQLRLYQRDFALDEEVGPLTLEVSMLLTQGLSAKGRV